MLWDHAKEIGLSSLHSEGFERESQITGSVFRFVLILKRMWEQANKEKGTFESLLLRFQRPVVCTGQK